MLEKWKKDYHDLLNGKYKRPQRWYDCRYKHPFEVENQQIPCRSLKCTSFHCNYARTEIDGKIRLTRFFIIQPNICAVIKFKKLPFLLDDTATSIIKKYLHQKLTYQRQKFFSFEFESKMELDSNFDPHIHMTLRASDKVKLSVAIKTLKKILKKAFKKAISKYSKKMGFLDKNVKIAVYCKKIKDLKRYANYISKRRKHLEKLVIFPESWNTKKCRVTSSTKGFKPLKSKELLAYYFKNKNSINSWGRVQNNQLEDSKPFNEECKNLEHCDGTTDSDEKTSVIQKTLVFSTFNNRIWKNSLNIVMALFLAVFSLYLIKNEQLETEKINNAFSDLESQLKQRMITKAVIENIQTVYLPRNDFHLKE